MKSSWLAVGAVAACAGSALTLLLLGPAPGASPLRGSTAGAVRVAPAPTVAPAAEPRALGPQGLSGVYRASYRHRLSFGDEALLEVAGEGRLDVRVEPTPAGFRARQRYRFAERQVEPTDAPALPAELALAAELGPDGALASLALPAGDVQARNYARALWDAAAARFVSSAGPASFPSARGEERTEVAPARVTRRRRLTASAQGPLQGEGELTLRFADGVLVELVGREHQRVPSPQGTLLATSELRWTRVAGEPEPGAAALTPGALAYEAAAAVELERAPARELPTLLQELERVARLGPPRALLLVFDALSRRLAAFPAEASLALDAIRHGGLPLQSQRALVDALATSATPEAQRALLALLDDGRPELAANLYLGLGDQAAPLSATVERLAADLDAPGTAGLLATGAAGILLARASAPPPALREALLRQLERGQDPDAVIDALAQSGDAALLELLAERGRSADPRQRAQAAEALRLVPGPEAEARLLALVADASPGVRAAALDACALRPASPGALAAVAPALGDPEVHALAHAALRAWSQDPRSNDQRAAVAAALAAAPTCGCAPLTDSLPPGPQGDRP